MTMQTSLHEMLLAVSSIWNTPGVSEFLATLFGGTITMLAQFIALRHDREKEASRQTNEQKAQAWAIFFKISQAFEALDATAKELSQHRATANQENLELWQTLQFPPHDWNTVTWEIGELVFLIDNKRFDLMQRYQEAICWLTNLVQSVKLYREMRMDFLTKTPSDVHGDVGSFDVTTENRTRIMPIIVHLKSLSESLEQVVLTQTRDVRTLMIDYTNSMKEMIGVKPNIQFLDEE